MTYQDPGIGQSSCQQGSSFWLADSCLLTVSSHGCVLALGSHGLSSSYADSSPTMGASHSWPSYIPKPHLKVLLFLSLGHQNIDFGGMQTFNLQHAPTPCWLLLDVEASFRLAREYWNKGEDGLYNPHISLMLIKVHLWCTLFCFQNGCWDLCYAASLHCSVPCSSQWSPLFPLKSLMPLPCWIPLTLCFLFLLIYIGFCHIVYFIFLSTEFLLYFHFENLFWHYFYLKFIVENPWKYT